MIRKTKDTYFEFHEKSSINKAKILPSRSKWPETWKKIYFKGYPRFARFMLDKSVWLESEYELINSILKRKSERTLSKGVVTKKDISIILLGGAITRIQGEVSYDSFRAYPSAGARYPLEIYLLILKSKDFKTGAYHYHVRTHSLEFLWPIKKEDLKNIFAGQNFVFKSKLIFVISSIMKRTTVKYSERGYRFGLIEAGHLAQNILLLAHARGFKSCPIGGFNDKKLTNLFELDLNDELVLYSLSIL